jgi:alanine-glyoxylate transaminase / serine-glyoxylate transaminase / serine-pyruvate transaminase
MTPAGVDGAQVIATAFRKYNLALGAGLGQMAGKLFRIGHLGDLNELMLLGAIAGAEMSMRDVGMTQIVPGSGVGAASEFWRTGGATSSAPSAKSAEKRGEPAVAAR